MVSFFHGGCVTNVLCTTGESTVDTISGRKLVQRLYMPWGEDRNPKGTLPTTVKYTGQQEEAGIGLYYYKARWYDSYLNRWTSPDAIIPSEGGIYTPLIVDYHETQFLEQLNQENKARLKKIKLKLPPVPINPQAFDRYAYVFNNPVVNTDPSGHCIWDLCILEIVGVTYGIVEIGLFIIAVGVTLDVITPGFTDRMEARVEGLETAFNAASDAASNSLSSVLVSKYRGDKRSAGEIIAADKQGRIKGAFPTEMLGKTYDEIVELAKHASGSVQKAAQRAKKLLDSKEYDKKEKR